MTLPGGLRFDEVRRGADASRSFGVLSWGQFVRFNAVRIGRTFHVTDNVPLQGKAVLRQISSRTGVRIVDAREIALSGQSFIPSSDTGALLSGEEREQAELAQALIRLNPDRPAPDFWDKMEAVNALYSQSLPGIANPVDILLRFRDLVEDPSLENVGDLLYAATVKPLVKVGEQIVNVFKRLF